jgi:hypothetical protein
MPSSRDAAVSKETIVVSKETIVVSKETTSVVIVAKSGKLTETDIITNTITGIQELTEILSKKCDNKKSTGFSCYHTWRFRNKNNRLGFGDELATSVKYVYIDLWAKTDGRAGQENKYELPPPIDEIIFFGNIALVARVDKEIACDLTLKRWNIIYEKLFGGFEDLSKTAEADEKEIDELALIPASKKTKNGYLKDGFIIEDDDSASSGASNKKKRRTGGCKKRIVDSESGSESEFVTETETESTTISTISSGDSDGVNNSEDEPVTPSTEQAMAPARATATATATATANTKVKLVKSSTKQKPKSKSKVEIVQNDETDDELVEDEYE